MKKNNHLHTKFIKFLLEKHNNTKETQELPDEETNATNKEIIDDFDAIINAKEIKGNDDDDDIEKLVKEFKILEKKYKIKKNDTIYNNRK